MGRGLFYTACLARASPRILTTHRERQRDFRSLVDR